MKIKTSLTNAKVHGRLVVAEAEVTNKIEVAEEVVVAEVDEAHLAIKYLLLLLVFSTPKSVASSTRFCSITVQQITCSLIVHISLTTNHTTMNATSQTLTLVLLLLARAMCISPILWANQFCFMMLCMFLPLLPILCQYPKLTLMVAISVVPTAKCKLQIVLAMC